MKNKDMIINNNKYIVVKDYKDAFDKEVFLESFTDYFYDYDFVVGDIAYGKLRLKGFYNSNSMKVKSYNDYKNVNNYIKEDCAYDCSYYIIKKIIK